MGINKIKNIRWIYLLNRKESLLFHSHSDCSYRHFKRLTGFAWQPDYILRDSSGDYFTTRKTISGFSEIFDKGDIKVFKKLIKTLKFNVKNLDVFSSTLKNHDYSGMSPNKLAAVYDECMRLSANAENFLLPLPLADKVVSEITLDALPGDSEEKKQKWLGILTYPEKENEPIKEERSFLNLVVLYKKNDKNFAVHLKRHLDYFSWISGRYYWEFAFKKRDIMGRIKSFLAAGKDPLREIKHLDAVKDKMLADASRLARSLKIKKGSRLHQLISISRELAYLRTWRTDIIYRSFYRGRKIFLEIAVRSGLNVGDIYYLTSDEAGRLIKSSLSAKLRKEIRKRRKFYVKMVSGSKLMIFAGKEWKKKISFIKQAPGQTGEIKGKPAFFGKVRGKVAIVTSEKDIVKVKKGDILVAVMTFPHFILAMEKASAFITDEGGITCYAAIVSREMKKPCITATKIATKVLRDGDLVEVDADKGVVKILKRGRKNK